MLVEGWVNPQVLVAQSPEGMLWVPNDPRNRHRQQAQELEAEGYDIPDWSGIEVYHDVDFSFSQVDADTLSNSGKTYGVSTTAGGITPYIASISGPGWGIFGALAQTPSPSTYDRCEVTLVNHAVNFGELRHLGAQVFLRHEPPLYPLPNYPNPSWNYFLQCPQGDLASAVPIGVGIRISGGTPILELRRGDNSEVFREWYVPLDGEGDDYYFNRPFHVLVSFKLHATHGFLRLQIRRPWDGKDIYSPDYYGPLGFTGGDNKCSVKFGLYRGAQDAQPGQNANPGQIVAIKKVKFSNTLPYAKTW